MLPQPAARPEQHTGRVTEASTKPGQQVSLDPREQREQHVTDLAIELALPAADPTGPARGAESGGSGTSRGRSRIQGRLHLIQRGVLVGADILGQHRVGHLAVGAAHAQDAATLTAQVAVVPGVFLQPPPTPWSGTRQLEVTSCCLGVVVSCRGGDSERGSGPTRRSEPFRQELGLLRWARHPYHQKEAGRIRHQGGAVLGRVAPCGRRRSLRGGDPGLQRRRIRERAAESGQAAGGGDEVQWGPTEQPWMKPRQCHKSKRLSRGLKVLAKGTHGFHLTIINGLRVRPECSPSLPLRAWRALSPTRTTSWRSAAEPQATSAGLPC